MAEEQNENLTEEPAEELAQQPVGIEKHFAALEAIIDRMDEEDVPLQEAFDLYQKGLSQVKEVNRLLDEMEGAMMVLDEEGNPEAFS